MKELTKTNRLTIVVSAIVLVIIAGLITLRKADVNYTLTPAESLAMISDPGNVVTPLQAAELLKDTGGNTLFVDVRNSAAYDRGHVKNAISIPVRELYSRKNKSMFRELATSGQTAVIYGETQQQANGPWMMLRQTGFKNILLFTGTYEQLVPGKADSLSKLLPLLAETPAIDTLALRALSAPETNAKAKTQTVKTVKKKVVPVKKEVSSGGGC